MEPELSIDAAALHAAFARVRANHGCAGADGVTVEEYERHLDQNLHRLQHALRVGTYRPFPLFRVLVEKKNGEARQLCIPAVRDRVAQAAALELLNPLCERRFRTCSYGYRRGRSVRAAVRHIRAFYRHGYRWVVEADVDAFFDSVDHPLLLDRVRELLIPGTPATATNHSPQNSDGAAMLALVTQWVQSTVWDGSQLYELRRGIPQGSVISPLLANLFLDEFDRTLLAAGQKLVRYGDDFVVLCQSQPQAQQAVELTNETMARLHLTLDELSITTFDAGFTFLGVQFKRAEALLPFDHEVRRHHVLFMPPFLTPGQYEDPIPPA